MGLAFGTIMFEILEKTLAIVLSKFILLNLTEFMSFVSDFVRKTNSIF
jgi:hypothetical protein